MLPLSKTPVDLQPAEYQSHSPQSAPSEQIFKTEKVAQETFVSQQSNSFPALLRRPKDTSDIILSVVLTASYVGMGYQLAKFEYRDQIKPVDNLATSIVCTAVALAGLCARLIKIKRDRAFDQKFKCS